MTDSPLARRDWHVARHAESMAARGLSVPTETLQRIAAEDLRLLDAARASGALRSRRAAKRPARSPSTQRAQDAADRIGGKAYIRALPAADQVRSYRAPSGVERQRLDAMVARIKIICTKVARVRNGQDMGVGYEHPALVTALAVVQHNFDAGRAEYHGKSDADRRRIYWSEIERICDASNAVIRPGWWVK